ncbi:MAG: hypothetical protein MJA32_15225 [Proteobacteria bacterium]|nr:hypothetical protein [Pseudomonadota bacterium]
MRGLFRNKGVTFAAFLSAVSGLAGCATNVSDIGHPATEGALVFGKLELVRNDERVAISDGLFGNAPVIHLVRSGDHERLTGRVGQDGEFAWRLEPGDYRVSKISFNNNGDRVETGFRFRVSVDRDSELIYVGTLRLVTRFFAGYYGVDGVVGYSVRNDCPRDCGGRIEELGMTEVEPMVALLR